MQRKRIVRILASALLIVSQITFAQSGDLFEVSSSGAVGSVQVRICLNGKGPTSCENHTVTNFTLNINTTIVNHSYPQIGIKALTSGYSFTGCTMYSNGYCIFSASDTSAATVVINASSDIVTLTNVNPSSGTASGGTGVTLTGANLTGATGVTFGGTAATFVNVVNSTTVTAVTPAHAFGAVNVVITTPNGSSTLASGYTFNTTAVGQSTGGGVVACLNGSTNNLISATADNSSSIQWGGSGTSTGAVSTTNGASNTTAIVTALGAGTAYAAGICDAYEVDSQGNTPCESGNACYDDWFLPARSGQLTCLVTNRAAIGGFSNGSYWSSTQRDSTTAWSVPFPGGSESEFSPKTTTLPIRCVRAFTP